ncbi:hypothetical protein ACN262_03780 [Burkholderia gladioli]|jgi:hypothetical protein|uniref:hypothetical protein n=1 Tax=Burkholderia gladioli TaxID=28095 RepID=UPI0016407752|nr:hypothetical protein [Burkholderia gladioli]
MAGGRPRAIIIALLNVVRDAHANDEFLTIESIVERVSAQYAPFRNDRPRRSDDLLASPHDAWWGHVMDDLSELGLVEQMTGHGDQENEVRWRMGASWQPPPSNNGGGRGRDDGPDAPRDDDEGGGIREVLGHPMLFALDVEQFDELLARMFEGQSR